MTAFEIYTLILCLIVFILLVSVFSYMLAIIIQQRLTHIKLGVEDKSILKEFGTNNRSKRRSITKALSISFDIILCLVFCAIFVVSLYINCTQDVYFDNLPTYRVVLTSSMEKKNEDNRYLFENNLDDQIGVFDLIVTHKIPKEEDLKLYDIVVYEVDDILVVHRIVGIEEPNQSHPNERYFLLQGDAVGTHDRFPVRYSQMQGIYTGDRIPFIGSFIMFMQSPAGWICILLVLVAIIATPILEKKLYLARKARYLLLTQSEAVFQPDLANSSTANAIIESTLDCTTRDVVGEIAITENDLNEVVGTTAISKFANFGESKSFLQKLSASSLEMQDRYKAIHQTLSQIKDVRIIEGRTQHSYKYKTTCIARLFFRGKTLHVALGLKPADYQDSKYIFTDISQSSKHKNYPMCIRLSSQRQTRWACELIMALANNNGLTILDKVDENDSIVSVFEKLRNRRKKKKSFQQKLKENPIAKERFNVINNFLLSINSLRVIKGKYSYTYKVGKLSVAKLTVKGKTLNAYLALDPQAYTQTKYIFTDVSATKKYANYPMRVKVSSERQVRWIKELVLLIINNN